MRSEDKLTVTVVITTFDHARFLPTAIESVLAQTSPPDEIIVVDDGSHDDPARVVGRYPSTRLITQENRGPSAARNTGWRASPSRFFIFLDADDRLLPGAIAAGLSAFADKPDSAAVYGGHRRIGTDGLPLAADVAQPIGKDPYRTLLAANVIGMNATVMFRREHLEEAAGFDEALRRCEDYDLYLRIAEKNGITSYGEIVAEYRWHEMNTSSDQAGMLRGALAVLDRHKARALKKPEHRAAWQEGRAEWRKYYALEMLSRSRDQWNQDGNPFLLLFNHLAVFNAAPLFTLKRAPKHLVRRFLRASRTGP